MLASRRNLLNELEQLQEDVLRKLDALNTEIEQVIRGEERAGAPDSPPVPPAHPGIVRRAAPFPRRDVA